MPVSGADLGSAALVAALVAAVAALVAGVLGSWSRDERLLAAARSGAFAVTAILVLAYATWRDD